MEEDTNASLRCKLRIFSPDLGGSAPQSCLSCASYNPLNIQEVVVTRDKVLFEVESSSAEQVSPATRLEGAYVTCISYSPVTSDAPIAALFTDGSLCLLHKDGSLQKKVTSAHHGAGITLKWNWDGSSFATGGEDGLVKVWSRSCSLRNNLSKYAHPVYSLSWGGHNGNDLVVAHANILSLVSARPNTDIIEWEVLPKESGIILSIDWNMVNNLIIAGSEDCRYRIFDTHGVCLFTSSPSIHVVTSVSWEPRGSLIAIGAFQSLMIANSDGQILHRSKTQMGSVSNIDWRPDGMQFIAACADGSIIFANVIGQKEYMGQYQVSTIDTSALEIKDMKQNATSVITLQRGDISKFSITTRHVLVISSSCQCFIYPLELHAKSTVAIDLNRLPTLIVPSTSSFGLIYQSNSTISIYSFEGRKLSNFQCTSIQSRLLTNQATSLSSKIFAIIDIESNKSIQLFESKTGNKLRGWLSHITHEVSLSSISLCQNQIDNKQIIVYLDDKKDLFAAQIPLSYGSVSKAREHSFAIQKIGYQIDSFYLSHDTTDIAAISTTSYHILFDLEGMWFEKDLALLAKDTADLPSSGKNSRIVSMQSPYVLFLRDDGILLKEIVSPFHSIIRRLVRDEKWEKAMQICRLSKSDSLWAACAGLALRHNNLQSLRSSLAALKLIDKVDFLDGLMSIERSELQKAELLLFKRGDPDEAVSILLLAEPPLTYHAMKIYIRLHKWEKALELASSHYESNEWYLIILLWYRSLYLDSHKESILEEEKSIYRSYFEKHQETIDNHQDLISEEETRMSNDERCIT